ncbi:hypothetical protein M569_02807, partial [Genlisea aurea]
FGSAFSSPAFGTPSTPGFGTPSTSSFGTSLFSTPFSQQQQTPSPFQTPQQQQSPFGATSPFSAPFGNASAAPNFMNSQLITQMAPVAPLPFSMADRDIQARLRRFFSIFSLKLCMLAIVDAYNDDAGNLKYAFKHLLFSVTEPQYRVKPASVSDIMWAEAIAKLEGMESSNRERLYPQLVQGFKDLSARLKLQDEVMLSDSERLKTTQGNVKMLQRHFQADTVPWIQRMQQKELCLQRRLIRAMRIIEALEGKGTRLPLVKDEVEVAEKLAAITRQLRGSGEELCRRVQNLVTLSRLQADGMNGGSVYLPGAARIQEQSLADMQEVLQRQTEAIARLGSVLKRDVRDLEIIMAEDAE